MYKENKEKHALIVSTVASTIDQFCMNDISILQNSYNITVAANFNFGNNTSKDRVNKFKEELQEKNIRVLDVELDRQPFSQKNLRAIKAIKEIIKSNKFDIIHCHTPVAAMIVRFAAKNSRKKNNTKVIYTAHGFHFFKGASLKNWIIYFPIEWWFSKYTDLLITINKEDYNRANKLLMAKKTEYLPGVGVDVKKIKESRGEEGDTIKNKLAIPEDGFVILSVGELNKNKNHETVIKALSKMNVPNIYYLICGKGSLDNYLSNLINKLNLEKNVRLLGYREDINAICNVSDLFVFPSLREGLSVALMEAMASGLPVICSKIRGNTDLIENEKGGYLVKPYDIEGYINCINILYKSDKLRSEFSEYNLKKIEYYSNENVIKEMRKLYDLV